jgi:uncharacterized damage-inducible protein DinB
MTASEE